MFDGILEINTGTEYKLQFLERAQLYHDKPIHIPKYAGRNS